MTTRPSFLHPGARIRADVIPKTVSVKKAAELMGVGRPALSNLLNGKAALTAAMAARLEKAFNYPRADLLEMQAQFDAAQAQQQAVPIGAKAYVPPFLSIKANDIERWASRNIRARSRFAVFLRTLVHSTGSQLTKVDFPGNDDSERPGWDGFVEAEGGSPWIPSGGSGWEFGINEDPRAKAQGDFQKAVKAHPEKGQRADITFVFVTPRRWQGKDAWVAEVKAKKHWKDVRAYDASNLEQWLEQSLPGQAWFANETEIPAHSVRSLDQCWADWANVSNPPLTGTLFDSAIQATKRTLLGYLSQPPKGPLIITADSTGEALALFAQLLGERGGSELASHRDRVLVFDKPGIFPRLVSGAPNFIPIALTRDVEREIAPHATSMHSIAIYPRNAALEAAISLEPVSQEPFAKALEEMGKERDEISRLANESGRSLTVLRRRLSIAPAVKTPAWVSDRQAAASLVPFLLVGVWSSKNETDRSGLSLLAGERAYPDLEKDCQILSVLDDAPIWSVGTYRGVVSKIDLLFAIADIVTADDLNRYFSMAEMVLGEDDPALDLEENQRWAAAIHGKTRQFSSAFRGGISETLVLLAIHGKRLFQSRLGIDTEIKAARLVRSLLPAPLTTRVLEANESDLATYAEAAPNEFLSILERDLASANSATLGLLRPVDPNVFGASPSRSGLLWALEGLCWSKATLARAALILARLAEVEINDNWVNKPARSLEALFRAWMPQTTANAKDRLALLKHVAKKHPTVAWDVCMAQIGNHHAIGTYSHKPKWRADGFGFGEPLTEWPSIREFVREVLDLALSWENPSVTMLCDLVERLHDLPDAAQARLWTSIRTWEAVKATDAERAILREKVRVSVLSRRAANRLKKNPNAATLTTQAKAVCVTLEPRDVLHKHAWLFRDTWVQESADELEDFETQDFQKRDQRIKNLRIKALREIYTKAGLTGIIELSNNGNAASVIGGIVAESVLSKYNLTKLLALSIKIIIQSDEVARPLRSLISGALYRITDLKERRTIVKTVTSDLSDHECAQFMILAPYCLDTWSVVDALNEEARKRYWRDVSPDWIFGTSSEEIEGVERLLTAGRPRAAFSSIRGQLNHVDIDLLVRILSAMAKGGDEKQEHYRVDQYSVQEAFKRINSSAALTLEHKARLEMSYIAILAPPWNTRNRPGIPNIELYLEDHPEIYIEAITWAYKRSDGVSETPRPREWVKAAAEQGHRLLDAVCRIPGHDEHGQLQADRLADWITTVRRACGELGRAEVADLTIGKLLSHAPVGADGAWPCECVRDVMEDIQSEDLMTGARMGVFNSRGAHWRGEGGGEEWALAEKYGIWGRALELSHPFVAAYLLNEIVRMYEHEAEREDTNARIRRRIH